MPECYISVGEMNYYNPRAILECATHKLGSGLSSLSVRESNSFGLSMFVYSPQELSYKKRIYQDYKIPYRVSMLDFINKHSKILNMTPEVLEGMEDDGLEVYYMVNSTRPFINLGLHKIIQTKKGELTFVDSMRPTLRE